MDQRIPYFRFVDREHGHDPEQSAAAGYEVPRLVSFIQITPHGHKGDPMEFFADDFIERKGREARDGRYSHEWVAQFKAAYAEYKAGREVPREGTPLITWERILKSRREQLAAKFPTVEDLAAVPDSALGEIGLDGRVLRDMAAADLQAKKDLSPVVRELAETKETNRRLEEQLQRLMTRLDALEGNSPRRGRPRNLEDEAA